MMLTRTVKKVFAGALVAVAMLASTAMSKAGTIIEYSLDNGATWTTLNSSITDSTSTNTTVGGFRINGSVTSNIPGTPSVGILASSTLQVTNNNNATSTIWMVFGADGFTQPVTPPQLLVNSHVGGSVIIDSAANKLSFASYIDQSNGVGHFAIPGTYALVHSPDPIVTTGSYNSDKSALLPTLSATYSVVEEYKITLGAGASLNFAANTTLRVPEPASMSILGVGLLGAAGYGIRRRKTQVSA